MKADFTQIPHLQVHPTGEIHIKSSRTRRRFRRMLLDRVRSVLRAVDRNATMVEMHPRLQVHTERLDEMGETLARVFGVHRVTRVQPYPFKELSELADRIEADCNERVQDRTYAVRVRRRGHHTWGSEEAMCTIGGQLHKYARKVDLSNPEVMIQIEVQDQVAWLVDHTWPGPEGLPLGAQDPCMALLSGGFDSPVAAWMMMRRGSPVDFLHFRLDCSASEHAMAVGHTLWKRWGWGMTPLYWMVDFEEVKAALVTQVDSRLRQVILKQIMIACADVVADRLGLHVLVTGESVGLVSSQTMSHLAAIDSVCRRTVLRPLAAHLKDEIIRWSRHIGTEGLSAVAQEVCDLSDGPVAVSAQWSKLREARAQLAPDLVEQALSRLTVTSMRHWEPGVSGAPVVSAPPEGIPLVNTDDPIPDEG
ncbi:MAG: THUMP domain-containing protein, partial [Myxococcota bacterium]|nr:THUMP domain-containing protein [Myxococcota bacterium]